jgi:hypothetical protein
MLTLVVNLTVFGQETKAAASGSSSTQANVNKKSLELASGTSLAAQLQNSIDVRKAKVGDQVVLKTTKAIKANGQTIVNKGSRLIGHITEVQQKTKGEAASKVGIMFDKLESGSLSAPISATITSITQAKAETHTGNDEMMTSNETHHGSSGQAQTSSSGGLLSGVTNTVGSVVDSTTQTTGNVVSGTTGTLNNTLSSIKITQNTSASAEGSSTLSLTGGNLRLEKGTQFNLTLSKDAQLTAN